MLKYVYRIFSYLLHLEAAMKMERTFELDGNSVLQVEDVFFVCDAGGRARLTDPENPEKSGGSAAALKVGIGDFIVTGFTNNLDVVVKVWRVELLIATSSGQCAEARLAHTLGASGHWKPDLGRRSEFTAQIESYAAAVKAILSPAKKRMYAGRR